MIVNNVTVTGIFVYDSNNKNVIWTTGDLLFYNDILYKCLKDTPLSPGEDANSEYWTPSDPAVTSADDLLNGTDKGKYATVEAAKQAIFGENGVARFLTQDGVLKSWGLALSEIKITSCYAINVNAGNIPDLPPTYTKDGLGIVNTFIGNGNKYQEVVSFDQNGKLYSFSTRINDGNWSVPFIMDSQSVLFQQYMTVLTRLRYIVKYLEETKEKYTIILQSPITSFDLSTQDQRPNINYKVQVKFSATINGFTTNLTKWIDVFMIDVEDSKSNILDLDLLDKGDGTNARLYLENGSIKSVNATITKIIKFIGNESSSADGTDYFRFEFST